MNLDPVKILVILAVVLVVVGPDRLPEIARKAGAAWRDLQRFRDRVAADIREAIPDVGSAGSPLAFLEDVPRPRSIVRSLVAGERDGEREADRGDGREGTAGTAAGDAGNGVANGAPTNNATTRRPGTAPGRAARGGSGAEHVLVQSARARETAMALGEGVPLFAPDDPRLN